jgi:hypothetical protein
VVNLSNFNNEAARLAVSTESNPLKPAEISKNETIIRGIANQ